MVHEPPRLLMNVDGHRKGYTWLGWCCQNRHFTHDQFAIQYCRMSARRAFGAEERPTLRTYVRWVGFRRSRPIIGEEYAGIKVARKGPE